MSASQKKLDRYIVNAWIYDILAAPILYMTLSHFIFFELPFANKQYQLDAISDLMNSNFTFAGFLLAALTIIVTFRANMKIKDLNTSRDALQLIISTDHYFTIVSVFKQGLLELIIIAFTLMSIKAVVEIIHEITLNKIFVTSLIISVFIVLRTLSLMFKIIAMEKHKKV